MPKYVNLVTWTDQGVRDVKQTTQRAESVRQLAEQMGGRIESVFWTLGRYDIVTITEMPDDETVTAFAMQVASMGTVRTETLRAFDAEEMGGILAKLE